MRHVCYVSGSRADFGLMASTLQRMEVHPQLRVSVCVTGQHLLPEYGDTVADIERLGLPLSARIPVRLDGSSGAVMARAIAHELSGLVDAFEHERPDMVLVLGDRGEMLAAALAAIHLNIPVVHIHGGERSGTVDEPVRHAISKLAHYHFTATPSARERLIRMGEWPGHVFVTGAPGLDGLAQADIPSRVDLAACWGFDTARPIALFAFHPVVQEEADAGAQADEMLRGIQQAGVTQVLGLQPNSDAGGMRIRQVLERYVGQSGFRLAEHLSRPDFLAWLARADVLVGNSSSGIIEAASFGLPVVNVGNRQQGRERSSNVTDVPPEKNAVRQAIESALKKGRCPGANVYGDGLAGARIVELLATLPLTTAILAKTNAY